MTHTHQNSLYLYDYCGHAFLQDISEYLRPPYKWIACPGSIQEGV
jgi:hypothetical protein